MDTTELELELLELEKAYNETRNVTEKADLANKINKNKNKIKDAKAEKVEMANYIQKDAPVRADHNCDNSSKSGFVQTNRESFVTIL